MRYDEIEVGDVYERLNSYGDTHIIKVLAKGESNNIIFAYLKADNLFIGIDLKELQNSNFINKSYKNVDLEKATKGYDKLGYCPVDSSYKFIPLDKYVANTELARFMYPDAEIRGDYLKVSYEQL